MKFTDAQPKPTSGKYAIPIVEGTATYREPLIISVYGNESGGKSRLIGTAKGKIGLVPLERKSRMSVFRAAEESGRIVKVPAIDLIRSARASFIETHPSACITPESVKAGKTMDDKVAERIAEQRMEAKHKDIRADSPMPECCQRCYYRWHAQRIKSVAYTFADDDEIETIAIDTFGQFVDDMYFACYGRNEKIAPLDKKSFNREVIEFINAINHKHLILIHHEDTVWKDNKPTERTKPKNSFNKIGHFTNVVVRMTRNKLAVGDQPMYSLFLEDCQANPGLIDLRKPLLTDDLITFPNLAAMIYDGSDPEEWE